MYFPFAFAFCFVVAAGAMASDFSSNNETTAATTMKSFLEEGISLRAKRSMCNSCCGGGSCCGTANPCASACCSVPSIPITITAPACACGVPGCSCGGCSCGSPGCSCNGGMPSCACGSPGCSCNGGMPSCACGSPGCSCGGGAQSALVIPIQTQTCCRCCQPVCAPACMQGGGCYTGC